MKIKKIISLFLTAVMIATIFIVPISANAATAGPQPIKGLKQSTAAANGTKVDLP